MVNYCIWSAGNDDSLSFTLSRSDPRHHYKKQPHSLHMFKPEYLSPLLVLPFATFVDIVSAISDTASYYVSSSLSRKRRLRPKVLHWSAKHQTPAGTPGEGRTTRRDFFVGVPYRRCYGSSTFYHLDR
jgi:hypothetical protein